MSFKEQLNNDAVLVFLNTREFAETVTYTAKGAAAKSIPALVTRQPISRAGEDAGRTLLNQVEIEIANDAENGVLSVNKGGDTVSLPDRVGGTDITWRVVDIIGQDEGMWRLLLQK